MAFDPAQPYNDLPALPPAVDLESRRALKACISARAAVAELKAAGRLIPNQGVLVNSIPLLEAQASSEIENIVTTTDQMFLFDGASVGEADPATKEALRYRTALWEGYEALKTRPLSTNTAVQICRAIKGVDMDIRKTPGTTLGSDRTRQVIYTPPEGEGLLREKLANWEQWMHGTLPGTAEIDPLVRMAAGHYQFEAIHPFSDGNGRAGRVLNSLFLIQEGLLTLPILYLSRFIIARKGDYYRLLLDVTRRGSWEPWVVFMLAGVEETAAWTTATIGAIRRLADATVEHVRRNEPKIYSRELVDVIFEQPYCRIANLEAAGIAKRQTASKYLKQLAALGVLEERSAGREKLFLHPKLLQLLGRDDNRFPTYR